MKNTFKSKVISFEKNIDILTVQWDNPRKDEDTLFVDLFYDKYPRSTLEDKGFPYEKIPWQTPQGYYLRIYNPDDHRINICQLLLKGRQFKEENFDKLFQSDKVHKTAIKKIKDIKELTYGYSMLVKKSKTGVLKKYEEPVSKNNVNTLETANSQKKNRIR